ncbi:MAG: anaerobic glycerol-3-phosphate dehydrogenase subunit C [Bryobacteraceae bacterium]|nr:anaerobic glycerol-3-phosphate dehydrogenase subunit C [Bryobacteraceae bacterium]MDW8379350.1 anaerobic glycerol-3-phosphate dehydrogenase subunit C [Bryobacterales bacterium]
MAVIKGTPTPGLTYNPNDPVYWDRQALQQEMERIFEICHGCRLCFNLCPSFPALFEAVDQHEGDVRKLTPEQTNRVIDLCYQCKLCYVKCPYTPDDKHEFQLDFPRLLLRANAVRRKENGLPLRSRILSRPEKIGQFGGLAPDLANWANSQPWMRSLMESILGIHRDKQLPEFQAETFETWYQARPAPPGDPNQAVLFHTCYVNFNQPQIGKDAVEVFSKNGVSLGCPKQNCCGMPALEAGDVELAKKLATTNVATLLGHVRAGKKVVAINPTCSYMLRKEYVDLVPFGEAREVAAATMDLCEFLFERKRQGQFNREFQSTPGRIAYHVPCHLKAQNIGYRSRDLMRLIPGVQIRMVEQCSGHDGTWAMKKEFFPLSLLAGKKAFDEMQEEPSDLLVSDCPLAAIQFEQAVGNRPLHPIQVLARAYRKDGFPTPVETADQKEKSKT